jgi:hypothetical protein
LPGRATRPVGSLKKCSALLPMAPIRASFAYSLKDALIQISRAHQACAQQGRAPQGLVSRGALLDAIQFVLPLRRPSASQGQ